MIKTFAALSVLAIFVAEPTASPGDLKLLKRERFIFENTDCEKSNSCDLLGVQYMIEDYRIELTEGMNFGTRTFSEYRTTDIESLRKYVFVQYIRGCVFATDMTDGSVIGSHKFTQPSGDNEYEEMNYRDWTLESFDEDPVYNSMPGYPRHHFYRWNKVPDSFEENTEKYFGSQKPDTPKLYVRDHPGTAFQTDRMAKNISLEFKTCLYKSSDVPETIPADRKIAAEPLSCYQWSSSWVYNHQTQKYDNPYGIAEACKK